MSVSRAAFDFYVPGGSVLHRIDPRIKIGIVLGASIVALSWLNLFMLTGGILATLAILTVSGYPRARLVTIGRALLPLGIVVIIVWPLFDRSGSVLFSLGPVDITTTGLLRGVATALRLAAVSFLFVLWVGTTDPRDLVRSFVRLGLPERWGMAITIGLRFIPTFAGMYRMVSDAQQSRGLVIEGNALQRARGALPILVSALVTALRASEQLAMTLESRAFGASPNRTVWRDIAMRLTDWLVLGLLVLVLASLLAATYVLGFGRDLISIYASG